VGENRVVLKITAASNSSSVLTVERRGYVCSVNDMVYNGSSGNPRKGAPDHQGEEGDPHPNEAHELQAFRLTMAKTGSSSSSVLSFRVLDDGRLESRESDGGEATTWTLALRRVVEAAIILDVTNEKQRRDADKFASTHLRRLVSRGAPIHKWGSVVARGLECPTYHPKEINPTHWPDKIVGITVAHKRIWEDFALRYSNQTSDNSPFLIVFEKDALCAVENCGHIALNVLSSAREDLVYLGWCWQQLATGLYPRCTHAYALSVRGAVILSAYVKVCREHVDMQMAEAEEKALITWRLADVPKDAKPLLNLTARHTHGLFIQNWGEHSAARKAQG